MIDPREVLIVLAIAGAVLLFGYVKTESKKLAHKTKCGVMLVIGKHCEPTTKVTP